MSADDAVPIAHINLFNPGLMPAKKSFTARSVTLWIVIAIVAMIGVAWWAKVEKDIVSRQVAEQAARREADAARNTESVTTPQQIAALDQAVQAKKTVLAARRAQRDALMRGVAADGGGPSAAMRVLAASIPSEVWLTGFSAHGNRLEISGRTINATALAAWMSRLGESKYFAAKPVSSLRLENTDFASASSAAAGARLRGGVSVYSFNVSAQLAQALADDGGRAP